MYIKQEDFNYLEGLYRSLDGEARKRFLDLIMKNQSERAGEFSDKVQIVGEDILDRQAIAPEEFITRTSIKKAYKAIKGVKTC